MKINYVKGDLFANTKGTKNIIVPHVCNDVGGWGSGFVVAVSKYDPEAEIAYRSWHKSLMSLTYISGKFALGETQIVSCRNGVEIANMVAQHKTISHGESKPIRYWALAKCMKTVAEQINLNKTAAKEIWAPKFGSGLAGGDWKFIETLIQEIWVNENIPVTIFEL